MTKDIVDEVKSLIDSSLLDQFTAENLTKSETQELLELSRNYRLHFRETSRNPIRYSVTIKPNNSNGAYK